LQLYILALSMTLITSNKRNNGWDSWVLSSVASVSPLSLFSSQKGFYWKIFILFEIFSETFQLLKACKDKFIFLK